MIKALIVISDMEIDYCNNNDWTFYDSMKALYASYGYDIPTIIFWNVDSRHDVFHVDANRKGVVLVSGQSTSTFKNLINCIGKTPYDVMLDIIGKDRYSPIKIAN